MRPRPLLVTRLHDGGEGVKGQQERVRGAEVAELGPRMQRGLPVTCDLPAAAALAELLGACVPGILNLEV